MFDYVYSVYKKIKERKRKKKKEREREKKNLRAFGEKRREVTMRNQ